MFEGLTDVIWRNDGIIPIFQQVWEVLIYTSDFISILILKHNNCRKYSKIIENERQLIIIQFFP